VILSKNLPFMQYFYKALELKDLTLKKS